MKISIDRIMRQNHKVDYWSFVSGNSCLIKSWESKTFSDVSSKRKGFSHYNFPVMPHSYLIEEAGLVKPQAQPVHINKCLWNFSLMTVLQIYFNYHRNAFPYVNSHLQIHYLPANWHWSYRKWWNKKSTLSVTPTHTCPYSRNYLRHDSFLYSGTRNGWWEWFTNSLRN